MFAYGEMLLRKPEYQKVIFFQSFMTLTCPKVTSVCVETVAIFFGLCSILFLNCNTLHLLNFNHVGQLKGQDGAEGEKRCGEKSLPKTSQFIRLISEPS